MTKLIIIASLIFFYVIIYAIVAVPKSKYDQEQDDEAQLAFLREYNKKNN